MANVLKKDKQVAVISMLLEGSSVRSAERITGVHRDTILRLMVRVGTKCAEFSDWALRDLDCRRIEVDEIWAFVAKKNKNVEEGDDWSRVGDQYTFVALDPVSKLIPSYKVGKRTYHTTMEFVDDLASRLRNRVQISSDGFPAYVHAIEQAFGRDVDYATVVKEYAETPAGRGRYSPPRVVSSEKDDLIGYPNMDLVSTSLVERSNLSIRTHCRRLTRLSLGFSKKLENFKASMDLYFAFYNFVREHRTIRCTPAMEAGVLPSALSIGDLVDMAA
ncbi:MAG: IS1 family transposase [Deltaproteobacteria bacterium]|nr:IS1 family transposase [Deltaproteobacteria bacterium]MBI3389705.1 IS1 family transposase [Deltaproteobacteria bacterium]